MTAAHISIGRQVQAGDLLVELDASAGTMTLGRRYYRLRSGLRPAFP